MKNAKSRGIARRPAGASRARDPSLLRNLVSVARSGKQKKLRLTSAPDDGDRHGSASEENAAQKEVPAPRPRSAVCHVWQPLHRVAQIVRRRMRVLGERPAPITRFLRQFPTGIRASVMPVRYALPCKSCSYERKRYRRIRTADTKSEREGVEPWIERARKDSNGGRRGATRRLGDA